MENNKFIATSEETSSPGTSSRVDRRTTAFREAVGAKVMQNETNKILQRLQPELTEKFYELAAQHQSGTETCINIPMTTRGIGFNTMYAYQAMSSVARQLPNRVPSALPLYRIGLLQLDKQMYYAHNRVSPTIPSDVEVVRNKVVWNPLFNGITDEGSIFVSESIRQVGVVTYADATYIPFVPDLERIDLITNIQACQAYDDALIAYHVNLEQYVSQLPDIMKRMDPPTYPGQRPEPVVVQAFKPDPFLVTFRNLRATVESLANPLVPVEIRNHFIRYNPIPGARFNDGLLLNADEIMPRNYNEMHLNQDNLVMSAFQSCVSKRYANYCVPVTYDGMGRRSVLCTLSINEELTPAAVGNLAELQPLPRYDVRCQFQLNGAEYLTSVIAMMSERPPIRNGEFWALRSPWLSHRVFEHDWLSLVQTVMTMNR